MKDIILYPTETLYALGANALDAEALATMYELKERDKNKVSSWLVRDIADIEQYAVLGEKGVKIAKQFLPGKLTLVLKAKDTVPDFRRGDNNEVSFRISSDPVAQNLIAAYMKEHNAPLTCTSANASGAPVFPTVGEILQQFGEKASMISQVIDDGARKGLASTVVRVLGDEVSILREGEISEQEVYDAVK